MTDLSRRAALALALAWTALVVAVIALVIPWGHAGTVAYCKSGDGFITDAKLLEDELDCVDRTVKDELNSRVDDVNVKGDAAIKGFKTDQTFSELRSIGPLILAAPSFVVTRLRSINPITFDAPMLYSSTAITLNSHIITIGLASTQTMSLQAPRVELASLTSSMTVNVGTGLRLFSNASGTQAPPASTLFADTMVKAYGRYDSTEANCATGGGFAFNATCSNSGTGHFTVTLRTAMTGTSYTIIVTPFSTTTPRMAQARNGGQGAGLFSVTMYDDAGALVNDWFMFMVIGPN